MSTSTELPAAAVDKLAKTNNEQVGEHQTDFGHVQDLSLQDQDKENFAPTFPDICCFALSLLLSIHTAIPLTLLKYHSD